MTHGHNATIAFVQKTMSMVTLCFHQLHIFLTIKKVSSCVLPLLLLNREPITFLSEVREAMIIINHMRAGP